MFGYSVRYKLPFGFYFVVDLQKFGLGVFIYMDEGFCIEFDFAYLTLGWHNEEPEEGKLIPVEEEL